jgi:hypothetical protein
MLGAVNDYGGPLVGVDGVEVWIMPGLEKVAYPPPSPTTARSGSTAASVESNVAARMARVI